MICLFPQYANLFGKPKEGLHSYRFFGLAAFDLFLTVIATILITKYSKIRGALLIFIFLMILGTIMHIIFCVHTTLTSSLFRLLT